MDLSALDYALPALLQLLTGPHLVYLLLGVGMGMVVGILPGLGGLSGMALLLPFLFGMEPGPALAMMIGLTSVTATSDTFSSVLIGVPGGAGAAATVMDGFPMTRRGEAARALSAAFVSSLIGGLFGALVLTFAFVAAKPILLAVGFSEQLMLVILALTLVGMLTGANAVKGLASCCLGLLIGTIGASQATAEMRFTFDTFYLTDGVPLVIVALGAFAIPEIIDVLRRHRAISEAALMGNGLKQGIKDTLHHWGLVLRCSAIGSLTGILPGLGGGVVGWVSYAHAVQTARDRSQFGKGDVRGVIGPEAANNAKDGADLIPTLFFGIPSSATMALLMSGLVVIGINPGRSMITDHVDLVYLIIWSIAIANVLATGLSLALARPIASLTVIRFTLIAPFVIVMIFFSAYQAKTDWADFVTLLVVGAVGLYMKRFGWSRAALLIGLVLSSRLESSLYRTVQIYGLDALLRPVALGILFLALVSLFFAWRVKVRMSEDAEPTGRSRERIAPQLVFAALLLLFVVAMAVDVSNLQFLAKVYPLCVATIAAVLLAVTIFRMAKRSNLPGVLFDSDAEVEPGTTMAPVLYHVLWLAAFPALAALVGFGTASMLYVGFFIAILGQARPHVYVLSALTVAVSCVFVQQVFFLDLPAGVFGDPVSALGELVWSLFR